MKPDGQKCIFCLATDKTFNRREHPIPESLGNNDLVLPQGIVCDACNQYFGSKIERDVLALAPFSVARVGQAVKNKGAQYPALQFGDLRIQSTGSWDNFRLRSDPPHSQLLRMPDGRMLLNPTWADPNDLVRFLLKMGLELLVLSENVDPYHANFDSARQCARYGRFADRWDFSMGVYPDRGAEKGTGTYSRVFPWAAAGAEGGFEAESRRSGCA